MYSEGNHKQTEKTIYRMKENICKPCNWLKINFQNTQTAYTAQYKKNNPIKKMGRRSKQTFLWRRDGQKAHEKILNIADYYRNANQNYNELSLHTSQNGHLKNVCK